MTDYKTVLGITVASKLANPDKTDRFLKTHKLRELTRQEAENVHRPT